MRPAPSAKVPEVLALYDPEPLHVALQVVRARVNVHRDAADDRRRRGREVDDRGRGGLPRRRSDGCSRGGSRRGCWGGQKRGCGLHRACGSFAAPGHCRWCTLLGSITRPSSLTATTAIPSALLPSHRSARREPGPGRRRPPARHRRAALARRVAQADLVRVDVCERRNARLRLRGERVEEGLPVAAAAPDREGLPGGEREDALLEEARAGGCGRARGV